MAASLRSTRSVAKAALSNRVGRMDHRLEEPILTVNARASILFRCRRPASVRLDRRHAFKVRCPALTRPGADIFAIDPGLPFTTTLANGRDGWFAAFAIGVVVAA